MDRCRNPDRPSSSLSSLLAVDVNPRRVDEVVALLPLDLDLLIVLEFVERVVVAVAEEVGQDVSFDDAAADLEVEPGRVS